MGQLLLGVDTGGTYTDAVLLRVEDRAVVASAKALTTRHDLAVGVSNAFEAIAHELDPAAVSLVSVSTTLATNAVVEGHGSPILVFLIGFDESMVARTGITASFPDATIVRVAGGHDHYGAPRHELDRAAIETALAEHGAEVTAVAVASTFAVRNTAHEDAARSIVEARTDLPVTVSSSLSEALDAPRRALTTALNARLLSRISDLVSAVDRSLAELGIDAPVMVAKGDGSLAAAGAVVRRPIETVLSGPAASIIGASALTGADDFVLSDVGGTTTDVGQLRGGRPRLVSDGARVGGWRTMVEAIDIRTTGLGGDSEVHTDKAEVSLGPQRRIPLALLGLSHPEVATELAAQLADPVPRDFAATFVLRSGVETQVSSAIEDKILGRLEGERPVALRIAAPTAVERRVLAQLVDRGAIQLAGFTPSDAAHVLGRQDNWDRTTAMAGARVLAWYTGLDVEEFCRRVWSEMVRRSVACVLEVAFDDPALDDALANPLVHAPASDLGSVGAVEIRFSMATPIVAVGGPAGIYYEAVANRCGAELLLPPNFDVANAVGAAAGEVVARSHSEVHSDGPSMFRVVTAAGSTPFSDATEAIAAATNAARENARTRLDELCGGLPNPAEPRELLEVERHDAPDAHGDEGLYSATVRLELRARPVG